MAAVHGARASPALIVAAGLWLMFGVPVDASVAHQAARGTADRRCSPGCSVSSRAASPTTEDLRDERDAVLRDLEGVYALLDAERGPPQAAARSQERQAS